MHDLFHHVVLPIFDYLAPSSAPTPSPSVTHALSTSPVPHASITTPSNPPQPSPPDNTVKVAIVTALGLVLATAITAVASTFKRDSSSRPSPTPDGFTRRYVADLEKDRRELLRIRAVYTHLREACYQRGLNPDDLIEEQEHRT